MDYYVHIKSKYCLFPLIGKKMNSYSIKTDYFVIFFKWLIIYLHIIFLYL